VEKEALTTSLEKKCTADRAADKDKLEGRHADAISKLTTKLERKNEDDLGQLESQLTLKFKKESD